MALTCVGAWTEQKGWERWICSLSWTWTSIFPCPGMLMLLGEALGLSLRLTSLKTLFLRRFSLGNYTTSFHWAFPGGSVVKNPAANAGDSGDAGLIDSWVGKIHWRRKWQPTLGFLPGKSHGQRWATVHGVTKVRHD